MDNIMYMEREATHGQANNKKNTLQSSNNNK